MTIPLTYAGTTVLKHGGEVRIAFTTNDPGSVRPLPVMRPSRTVSPITVSRNGSAIRTFWSMSAWKRNFEQRSDGQWYGQAPPYTLFVYLHVHADDVIQRGQSVSATGLEGAFDDILRSSGFRTAAFTGSTSDGGTLPPFVNDSRVGAGGWYDASDMNEPKTIYYGPSLPANAGPNDKRFKSEDDSPTAGYAQFDAAILELNKGTAQFGTSAGARRLLIATGLDIQSTNPTLAINRDDNNAQLPLYIGTYNAPGAASTARPILRIRKFRVDNATVGPLHLQGLHIINTANGTGGEFVNFAGGDSASCQDCLFERGANVDAGWVDRCIVLSPTASGTDIGPPMSSGRGNHRLVTNSVFAGPGMSSHLNYGIGGARPDTATGPQAEMEMFDLVVLKCPLSDMGRARDWSGYRATCRVVADQAGSGFLSGVNGIIQKFTDINNVDHYWTYRPASGSQQAELQIDGDNSGESSPGGLVRIATGSSGSRSWNDQNIMIDALSTGTQTGGFYTVLHLHSEILDTTGNPLPMLSQFASAFYGTRPARGRNENHRHLINIRPGYMPKIQNVQDNFGFAGLVRDFDGYWMYDSITVYPDTIKNGTNSSLINPGQRYSSDLGPDILDVRFEHLTAARSQFALMDWQSISPEFISGATDTPLADALRLWLDWSISDRVTSMASDQNSSHYYMSVQNPRRLAADRNIYGQLQEDAGSTTVQPVGFSVPGHGSNFDTWQGLLTSSKLDLNSRVLTGPLNFPGSPVIYDDTDPPSPPVVMPYTLDSYDLLRAPVPWGEAGTTGSLTRLYNAVTNRPMGQWSEAVNSPEMARAVLAAYLPADHAKPDTAFPDNIGTTAAPVIIPIGASDYAIPQPSNLSATGDDPGFDPVPWTISWNRPANRADVKRYLVALYSGSQGTPLYTREVWSTAATGISVVFLLNAGTYTVTVHASEGMNRTIEPAAYTFTV